MHAGNYDRVVAPEGYPGTLYQDRYCYEHHAVWWINTGQIVEPGEHIHHKNGDGHDNRLENLELVTAREHIERHGRTAYEHVYVTLICDWCGRSFEQKTSTVVIRRKVRNQTRFFCSLNCTAYYKNAVRRGDYNQAPRNPA